MTGRLFVSGLISAALALGLAGCDGGPQLAKIEDGPPLIAATVESRVTLDALLPTDLLGTASGEVLVLDGYAGRILRVGPDGAVTGTLGSAEAWGRPLRLAEAHDGTLWLTDPGGRLLHVGADGAMLGQLGVPALDAVTGGSGPAAPVAVIEAGNALVISDRAGRLSWIDPASGAVIRQVIDDANGDRLSLVADLTAAPDGRLLGVDTLTGRIQVISPDGQPLAAQGHYGAWAGTLKQPKGIAALGDEAVAVVDSELGALQIFDADGAARGVVAVDGAPLALTHPVAVERVGADELLVLDAGAAALIRLKLDAPSLKAALDGPPRRWLHTPLKAASELPPVGSARCISCHSGVVNDSREVWDNKLDAHPVNIKPEKTIPAYFPLSDEGQLVCTTCHSPHGAVSLGELKGAESKGDAAVTALVPHEGDHSTFLRMGQGGSELCVACHTDAAHEGALAQLGLGGGGHPTGEALVAALAKRGGEEGGGAGSPDPTKGQCLTCHAVHGATGEHLTRGETDGALCVACHADEARAGRTHPMGMNSASDAVHPERTGLPLDTDGHVSCRTCHALVEGSGEALLRPTEGGKNLCVTCHTDEAHGLGGGHSRVRGDAGISCLGCHDPHGTETDHALLRTASLSSTADPQGCLGCHGKGGAAAKAGVLPGVLGHPVDGEAHGTTTKALTCESCHDAHNPRTDKSVAGCESCHAEQASAAHRGGHGQATCLDCHPMHSAAPKATVASSVNPRAATCLACHAEGSANGAAPKVASFTHPAMVFAPDGSRWTPLGSLPLFAADGSQQPAGTNGALTCSSCHLTHGPDAAEPGDNLRRPGWKEACSACHGENALPLYRYFHQQQRWPDVEGAR